MKVHEEAMKMMGKAIEEIDWICANGDAHDLKDACDMACRRMEEAIALIQQLDGEMSELERVRADLTATNMQLRDAVFKNELFKRRGWKKNVPRLKPKSPAGSAWRKGCRRMENLYSFAAVMW